MRYFIGKYGTCTCTTREVCDMNCPLYRYNNNTPSHYDTIHNMNIEELAQWLDLLVNKAEIYGENKTWLKDMPRYYSDWLEWLKSGVENVER